MKGHVTVFVSLMMAVLLFFFQAALQSARTAVLRGQMEEALELTEYSVLSEYQPEMLERYGVFYLDLGYGSSVENSAYLEQRMRQFLNENLSGGSVETVQASGFSRATDGKGMEFYEQAVSYMKQKTGVSVLEQFLEYDSLGRQAEEQQEAYEAADRQEQENLEELSRRRAEEEEEETTNPIEETTDLKGSSILHLVLKEPERVSGKKADLSQVPSARNCLSGSGPRGIQEGSLTNDTFFHSYLLENFYNTVSAMEETEQVSTWLDYQLEYVIAGKDSDIGNLEAVCGRLLAMREGLNYVYLQTDSSRVEECETLAVALVGITLIPELVEAVKQILLLGWAFAESVLDVRILLSGNRLDFAKSQSTWKTSLTDALHLRTALSGYDGQEDAQGLRYQDYLGILLTVCGRETKAMRSLDVMEGVIRGTSGGSGFLIDQCTDGFQAQAVVMNGRELTAQRWFCYEW